MDYLTALQLVDGAVMSGISLWLNGDNVSLKPKSKAPDELLARMIEAKPYIVAILRTRLARFHGERL